jgi:hypothetical protein
MHLMETIPSCDNAQVRLLELWDEIGLPYEDKKQELGPILRIIGFDVDPNAMTVTIPHEARSDFLTR